MVGFQETRSNAAHRKIALGDILLILLACEILVPRISIGSSILTLDDVIPLIAGALGALVILQSRTVPRLKPILFLLIWIIFGLLTAVQNTAFVGGFGASFAKGVIRPLNSMLILALLYKLTYQKPYRVTRTLHWIVWVATLEGILAVVTYTLGVISNSAVLGLEPIRTSAVSKLIPGRFVGTPNTAGNFTGAFFLMVIPLTIALALTKQQGSARRRYGIALALQVFGLVMTFTRSSFLFLVVVSFWLLILLRKKRLVRMYVAVGCIVALVVGFALPEYILRLTADRTGRLTQWTIGLRMMQDHPTLGVGFDRYMDVVALNPQRYVTRYNPHNWYIMMGAEAGVAMLIVGIGLAVSSLLDLYGAYRSNTTEQGRILLAGLVTGAAGFLLQNLTNDLLHHPHLSTYFWLFYVLGVNVPGGLRVLGQHFVQTDPAPG